MATSPSAVEPHREAATEERPGESQTPLFPDLVGAAPPSPAGPIDAAELAELAAPPDIALPKLSQTLRFSQRQIEFVFKARRELGEVFRMQAVIPGGPIITSHPDHVRSLFTAKPEQAPSLTGESPLRPIVGPNSVLTAIGPRHMRQRKLLLPPFHGEAIERYTQMIADGGRARDRQLAGRRAVRAGAADAGDHARRDHGRDLRRRGQARAAGRPRRRCGPRSRKTVASSTWPTAQLAELLQHRARGADRAARSRPRDARPADLRGDRAPAAQATDLEERARHPLAAPAGADRGRRGARRRRTARRAR